MAADSPMAPLTGVRIADFSSNMAGPFAAMILAQLGADVIKVEAPAGDDARKWPPMVHGESATHRHMSVGKRGMVIDLKRRQGVDVALRLIDASQVVLHSMRPGVAERLGIGKDAAFARNPELLYYELSAFGDGPIGAAMPGYDPLIQAYSGIMAMTGHEGAPPVRCAPPIIDLTSGQWIAMGILAALLARTKGERISTMHTALVDTAFSLVPHQAMHARATGERPRKNGSGNTIAAPYQCFRARDGDILIAAASERLWRALLGVLQAPQLADDPRFATNAVRVTNVKALESAINAMLATRDVADWLSRLAQAGVPSARVSGLEEAVVGEIARERGTFMANGDAELVRLPWQIDGRSLPWRRPAPEMGEHTYEVLAELGYGDDEIANLVASGAVAGRDASAPLSTRGEQHHA